MAKVDYYRFETFDDVAIAAAREHNPELNVWALDHDWETMCKADGTACNVVAWLQNAVRDRHSLVYTEYELSQACFSKEEHRSVYMGYYAFKAICGGCEPFTAQAILREYDIAYMRFKDSTLSPAQRSYWIEVLNWIKDPDTIRTWSQRRPSMADCPL